MSPSTSSQPSAPSSRPRARERTRATTSSCRERSLRATVPTTKPVAPVRKTRITEYSLSSAEDEALRQRIVRREPELASSGDPGAPFDLRHDRLVTLPLDVPHRPTDKARPEDALDD